MPLQLDNTPGHRRRWTCGVCKHGYSLPEIEGRLVGVVAGLERGYQLQDLACGRCRQVAASHLRAQCEMCSGALVNTVTPAQMAAHVRVFRSIALYHSFALLLHTVDLILDNSGAPALEA